MTDTAGRGQPVMPAGRELDALVAEQVMLWKPWNGRTDDAWWQDAEGLRYRQPKFSTDWDAMRLVVERLVALGYVVELNASTEFGPSCVLASPDGSRVFTEKGETLPHAVALAALKAVQSAKGAEAV